MSQIKKDTADVTRYVLMVDAATGQPETGLTITNFDLTYVRNRAAASKADATALGSVDAVHADNEAIEVDATNCPGLYRIDWPDAAFAAGVDKVALVVNCMGCHPAVELVDLVNFDPEDGLRLGLTALPNAAADGPGGLPVSDGGGLDLDAVAAAVANILIDTGTTLPASFATIESKLDVVDGIVDDILVDTGTSLDGKLDTISGNVNSVLEDTGTTLDSKLDVIDGVVDAILADTGTDGVLLAAGAITAAKYDAATAFPLTAADVGATAVARTGDDGDTLETLSDQMDAVVPPAVGDIADAVWDELLAGHVIVGSAGAAMAGAGAAGDPWSTPLPGAYGAGTAGYMLSGIDGKITVIDAIADDLLVDTSTTLDDKLDSIITTLAAGAGAGGGDGDGSLLGDAIAANAAGPKKATGDSGSIEQHSLQDQIEADRYLAAKKASANKARGLRFTKLDGSETGS
jgi:hypothetical protein